MSTSLLSLSGHEVATANLEILSQAIEDVVDEEERSKSPPHLRGGTNNDSLSLKSASSEHSPKRNYQYRRLDKPPTYLRRHSLPTSPTIKKEESGEGGDSELADSTFCSPHHHQMVVMPSDFVPGPYDVLCGRGRACKTAVGNLAYRDLIFQHLSVYAAAESKLAKGQIISDIMTNVRDKCYTYHKQDKVGGFVKCVDGVWYEVGDFLAREKTSQCFRDALSTHYSSSAQSKYLRRRAKEAAALERSGMSNTLDSTSHHNKDAMDTTDHVRNTLDLALSQLPFKKRQRRLSEETAVDALQQMASMHQASPRNSPSTSSSVSSMGTSAAGSTTAAPATNATFSTESSRHRTQPAPSQPPLAVETVTSAQRPVALPIRNGPPTTPSTTSTAPAAVSVSSMITTLNEVRICALQPGLRPSTQSPWDALMHIRRLMETIAAKETVDLFVLPELCPIGYSEDTFARYLPVTPANQAMYQEFDRFFQITARSLNVYICYGTIGWSFERQLPDTVASAASHPSGIPKMFIRQIVVDRLGTQVACYDKMNLCDYGICAETRFFCPGPASHPTSFVVHCRDRSASFRFGLVICADMRYPELARRLTADSEHRVDCILQPAAFARDCSFRTWSSFQETRAVENSIYWIAVNYAGTDFGESSVVPPFVDEDNEPIKLGIEEGYIIGRVSRRSLDHVRTTFPFYRTLLKESGKSVS